MPTLSKTGTPSFAKSTSTFYKKVSKTELREITIVNKKEQDSFLLTIHDCEAEQEFGEQFTYETATNQYETLCTILKNNGYKEDPYVAHNAPYHTYEDNTPMMSIIKTVINDSNTFNRVIAENPMLYPLYIRELPKGKAGEVNILHFDNNILRNKHGIPVFRNYHSQLNELVQMGCAVDIIDYKFNGVESYIVIDFALNSEYSKRRNLYYELNIEIDCDLEILNVNQLSRFLENSDAEQFIIKTATSQYVFGETMTDAYLLNTTMFDKLNPVVEVSNTITNTNGNKTTNNAIGICIERGILV